MASEFRYSMKNNERHPSNTCICKLWFGKKYLIRKFKALHQGLKMVSKDIDRKIRLGYKDGDIYEKAILYINRSRCTKFEVEVFFTSDNAQELLLNEHNLLKKHFGDDDCLNTSSEVEIPKWIPRIDVDAFLNIKDGIKVNQVIVPARGGGAFRIKSLKDGTGA